MYGGWWWREKAEGDCCTPQRCMTHICYWQHGTQRHTYTQGPASLFSGPIFSKTLQGTVDCSRRELKTISGITTLLANLSQDRPGTIPLSLSTIAISLCLYAHVCLCVCQRSWEPLTSPRAPLFQVKMCFQITNQLKGQPVSTQALLSAWIAQDQKC